MRRTLVFFLMFLFVFSAHGCARSSMKFQLAPRTTQNDFQQAKIECGEDTGGGGFIFGPAIIVVGVIAAVESVRFVKKNKFQDCMEAKGFKCVTNCAHESTIKIAASETSLPPPIADHEKSQTATFIEKANDDRFADNGNGTVTDTKAGLMWAARDNGYDIKWTDAKDYCDNYRGGGHTDWRMPAPDEMAWLHDKSKVRRTACEQSCVIGVATELIDITCYYLWTSETGAGFMGLIPNAAYVYLEDGSRNWVRRSSSDFYRVIPVRTVKK